jgi:hypothetical protein
MKTSSFVVNSDPDTSQPFGNVTCQVAKRLINEIREADSSETNDLSGQDRILLELEVSALLSQQITTGPLSVDELFSYSHIVFLNF